MTILACLGLREDGADGGDAVAPGDAPEVRLPAEALGALATRTVLDGGEMIHGSNLGSDLNHSATNM